MQVKPSTSTEAQVHEFIVRAREIADARLESVTSSRLAELGERLERRDFNVAVLGEFKRGKSSLVNALLGVPVLPTGVLPLTSVVTRLRWGEVPSAQIRFEDGASREIPIDQLNEFVTEAGNPQNRLHVAAAEVAIPSDLLRSGALILDTPGVGSTFEHNTETTLRLLEDVDAAIFVTAADPPVSKEERAFLATVKQHAHKVFFVLNKVDVLEPGEVDQVFAFTRSVICEAIEGDAKLFAVSARRGLRDGDAGLDAFADALIGSLDRELVAVGTASVAQKACELVAQIRAGIAVELEALRMSVVEIAYRRDQLAAVRRTTEEARTELGAVVQAEVGSLIEMLEDELAEWRSVETERLIEGSRRAITEGSASPVELDRYVKDLLRSDVETWRPTVEATLQSRFSAASTGFIARADDAATRAIEAASEILDLDLPRAPSVDGLSGKSRFTYSFFEVPTVMESLLPDSVVVLPTKWAERIALRRAHQKIPMLVDRHSGRIRYDLVTRLQASAAELTRALELHLAGTTEGLEAALVRAQGSAGSFEWSEERTSPGLMALDQELFTLSDRLWDSLRDLRERSS